MGHAALANTFEETCLQIRQQLESPVEQSFLTQSIKAAEAYLNLTGTEAELHSALSKVKKDIESFLARATKTDFDLPADLIEVLNDSLSLLSDFSEEPTDAEDVALFLTDAQHFHSELLALCAASQVHKLKEREAALKVEAQMRVDVSRTELTRGLYKSVVSALRKGVNGEDLFTLLESHYDQVSQTASNVQNHQR